VTGTRRLEVRGRVVLEERRGRLDPLELELLQRRGDRLLG
jgi:hypothetical protein